MFETGNCYFVRLKKTLAVIYREHQSGAFIRFYGERGWGDAELITDDISGGISVNTSRNDDIFVFCQSRTASIIMHHYNGSAWKSAVIRKNSASTLYNLRIYSIVAKSGLYLLYNIPSDITGGLIRYKIVLQELSSGKWSEHFQIASVLDSWPVFSVYSVSPEHFVVYYTERGISSTSVFGYRELSFPDMLSDFKPLFKTDGSITDKSVITTDEGVHAAIILKGQRQQLVYRDKLGTEPGPPVTLFESGIIENVALFMYSGSIHIVFSAGSYGYFSTTSHNGGKTFSRPVRVNASERMIKAEYASCINDGGCFIGNVLTGAGEPGKAYFLEDVFPFYSYNNTQASANALADASTDAQKPQNSVLYDDPDITKQKEQINEKTRRITSLEKKLEDAFRDISDKERQITELNTLLTYQSGDEWSEAAGKLRSESSEKSETISRLQDRIIELQGENAALAASLEQSKNDNLFLEKRLESLEPKNQRYIDNVSDIYIAKEEDEPEAAEHDQPQGENK